MISTINLARLERQRSLPLTLPRSVSVIGCGGVGSWCALFLALAGVPVLNLWDDDEVSETNLNRLPYGAAYLNLNKAVALKLHIFRAVPDCEVTAYPNRWTTTGAEVFTVPEWVIVATDSHTSRRLIHTWAKHCQNCDNEGGCAMNDHRPRSKYIEVSAEGEYGGCAAAPAMFTTAHESEPGYQSVPVWVGPTVGAAMIACAHILHGYTPHSNHRLGWDSTAGMVDLQHL